MICSNCGHDNAPGNRFCGSCGKPVGTVSDETQVVETVAPAAASSAAPAPNPAAGGSSPSGDSSVFCWNCGAANTTGRRYCHRCGEELAMGATGGLAAGAGGGRGRRPPPDRYDDYRYDDYDGGGRGRSIAIAVALLAILLLAGGAMFMFLGGGGPTATPTPSPTAGGLLSPSPDASLEPSPDASPSPELSPEPTAEPTAEPSPTPEPTASPTPTPAAPPTLPPTPTPVPTPANCDGFSSPTTSTSLTAENPTRQISNTRVWCVSAVEFGDGQGDGTLKIFLTNPVFLTSEYGYSSATIGWTEVVMQDGLFSGGSSISPPMDLIHPLLDQTRAYRMFPQGTEIQLQVMCDGGSDCSGSVRIDHQRRPAPPLP